MLQASLFKICFRCEQPQPITDFYRHPEMRDGRLNKCKQCTKRDVSKNYRGNIEHYRQYDRKRFQWPERKKHQVNALRLHRLKFPEKTKARTAVSRAVRSGRLIKEPCINCGEVKVDGHHENYSRYLDVIWFCRACHHKHHQEMLGSSIRNHE